MQRSEEETNRLQDERVELDAGFLHSHLGRRSRLVESETGEEPDRKKKRRYVSINSQFAFTHFPEKPGDPLSGQGLTSLFFNLKDERANLIKRDIPLYSVVYSPNQGHYRWTKGRNGAKISFRGTEGGALGDIVENFHGSTGGTGAGASVLTDPPPVGQFGFLYEHPDEAAGNHQGGDGAGHAESDEEDDSLADDQSGGFSTDVEVLSECDSDHDGSGR